MSGDAVAPLRRRVLREAAIAAVVVAALVGANAAWQLLPAMLEWDRAHPGVPVDDLVFLLAASHLVMLVFGARRARDLKREFVRRRAVEARLRHRARHDPLTGALNRAAITEAADAAAREAATGGHEVCLLLLDLDRFKEVNDSLGHRVGDALLVAVADRFRAELGDRGMLARLGGDEFVVLLAGRDAAMGAEVAHRLVDAARSPFEVTGLTLEIDASIGVAAAPEHAVDGEDLLRCADVAMYAAKTSRRGVGTYSHDLDSGDADRQALYGELRRGIAGGELRLQYQPKAALRDGRVAGVEALVRWQHPRHGLLPPSAFIAVAEQTGLIRALTDVVLEQALRDCRTWRREGLALTVAVNLSPRVLLDVALPDRVAALLRAHGLDSGCLELEITEGATMQDPGQALRVLHRLRDLGVGLSVDDYGTGHASLAYLSRLPVTTLKIDRSFVRGMEHDRSDHTIVRSTIDLARNLGLRVVAEGVETREAWQQLAALGCDEAQGYWLARPTDAAAIPGRIARVAARVAAAGVTAAPA